MEDGVQKLLKAAKEPIPEGVQVQASPKPASTKILFGGVLICAAIFLAYSNSFQCPFIFDDAHVIWNYTGKTVIEALLTGLRPVFTATFLLNQIVSADAMWGWHFVNICFQALSALVLFGLVRRTLLLESVGGHFKDSAFTISLLSALIWALHPVHAQAVTYVTQRGETMVCLFMFLLLYCMLRAEASFRHRLRWHALAFLCCCLGLGSKEAMISALPVAVLFDRSYLSGSFKEIWRKNKFLYTSISAIYVFSLLFLMIKGNPLDYLDNDYGIERCSYLLTETEVILHYLKNSFCPLWLCFDYDWPIRSRFSEVVIPAVLVSFLLVLTIWAWIKYPKAAFPGIFFFLCLAPRSSLLMRPDACVDYRMCMPLAGLVILTVFVFFKIISFPSGKKTINGTGYGRFAGLSIPAMAIISLLFLTYAQNQLYSDPILLWMDTVARSPANDRALNYLGIELVKRNRLDEAKKYFLKSLSIRPANPMVMNNLATILKNQGELAAATSHYGKALEILSRQNMKKAIVRDNYAMLLCNTAEIDLASGRDEAALGKIEKALGLSENNTDVNLIAGKYFLARGNKEKALRCFTKAQSSAVAPSAVRLQIGRLLMDANCPEESLEIFLALLAVTPLDPLLNYDAGLASLRAGHIGDARKYFKKTLDLDPSLPMPLNDLGTIAVGEERMKDAEIFFRRALSLVPDYPEARFNLGMILKQTCRVEEAFEEFSLCAKLRPGNPIILDQIEECRKIISGEKASPSSDKFKD
jgi:tetratricopeptide (TPR) repeat protein